MKRLAATTLITVVLFAGIGSASARGGDGYPLYPYGGGQSHTYIPPVYGW